MQFQISFKVNEHIYLRDPESSELGKQIITNGIVLINQLGFEQFTFKKLAIEMNTTEASIYRYFENKHRLLLYILNWYWNYIMFLVTFRIQNITDTTIKLKTIIHIISSELPLNTGQYNYNMKALNQIVISESNKTYLIKEINEINKHHVFKPYKDLCAMISKIINIHQPKYKYAHSLSSSIIEMAQHQNYFIQHLPKLTDVNEKNKINYTTKFIEDLLFKTLN